MPGAVGECLGDAPPQSGVVHLRAKIGKGARREGEHVVGLRGDVGRIALDGSDPARQKHLRQRKVRLSDNGERSPTLFVDISREQSR